MGCIFMMVFGMTRPGGELTTYRADTQTTKPIRHGTMVSGRLSG